MQRKATTFAGYEMHMGTTLGTTLGADCARAFAGLAGGAREGAISPTAA